MILSSLVTHLKSIYNT